MQHDVFANPVRRVRRLYPFVADLQASIVDGPLRLIAPLALLPDLNPPNRAFPRVAHEGRDYLLVIGQIASLNVRQLGKPVGSIASYRDEITRALDWIFLGI